MFAKYLGDVIPASRMEPAGEKLFYSVTQNSADKRLFVKLVNASSSPRSVELRVDGAVMQGKAKVVRLSAQDTQATNTVDRPLQVAPVESTATVEGAVLRRTMPGYCIEVIEVAVR